jgi:hypothetical protein
MNALALERRDVFNAALRLTRQMITELPVVASMATMAVTAPISVRYATARTLLSIHPALLSLKWSRG